MLAFAAEQKAPGAITLRGLFRFLPYASFQSTNPFPLSSSSMWSYAPLEINDVIKLVKNVVKCLFACRFFSIFAMKNKTQVWKMWRISQKRYQKCVNLHIFRTLTMEVLKNV